MARRKIRVDRSCAGRYFRTMAMSDALLLLALSAIWSGSFIIKKKAWGVKLVAAPRRKAVVQA